MDKGVEVRGVPLVENRDEWGSLCWGGPWSRTCIWASPRVLVNEALKAEARRAESCIKIADKTVGVCGVPLVENRDEWGSLWFGDSSDEAQGCGTALFYARATAKIKGSGQECPLHTSNGNSKVKGSGQECPLHTSNAYTGYFRPSTRYKSERVRT